MERARYQILSFLTHSNHAYEVDWFFIASAPHAITYGFDTDTPNWVGHLITKYGSEPHYAPECTEQSAEYKRKPWLIYDYARGGDTVPGLAFQLEQRFLIDTVEKHGCTGFENSLFVCWIGINDCAFPRQLAASIQRLFLLFDRLHEEIGAQNFMFVDVPPIERSPAVREGREGSVKATCTEWNNLLRSSLDTFAASHPASTVLLYSSHELFNRVLDNPNAYGLEQSDVKQQGGKVWVDHLHPTSIVHDILAKDIASFLQSVGVPQALN